MIFKEGERVQKKNDSESSIYVVKEVFPQAGLMEVLELTSSVLIVSTEDYCHYREKISDPKY